MTSDAKHNPDEPDPSYTGWDQPRQHEQESGANANNANATGERGRQCAHPRHMPQELHANWGGGAPGAVGVGGPADVADPLHQPLESPSRPDPSQGQPVPLETGWTVGTQTGSQSGVSTTHVKPIGAPEIKLGESRGIAATRDAKRKSRHYRQVVAVAGFVLIAVMAAILIGAAVQSGDRQVADSRIEENATGRSGNVEGDASEDGLPDPVPAQAAEDAQDPASTGSTAGAAVGSQETSSSTGSSDGGTAPAGSAPTTTLPTGPTAASFTYSTVNGAFVLDGNEVILPVGSTLTIRRAASEKGQNPFPLYTLVGTDAEFVPTIDPAELALRQDGAFGDGEDVRYTAVEPGFVVIMISPIGQGASPQGTDYILVAVTD